MKRAHTGCTKPRPIVTKIVGKYQITVPGEIRVLFDLQEGDLFEWKVDQETSSLTLVPKRSQLITPVVEAQVEVLRAKMRGTHEKRPQKLANEPIFA